VFLGSSCGLYSTATCSTGYATPWVTSGSAGAAYGYSVASAGDVNGDGCSDVLVGAFSDAGSGSALGRAFLYLGCTSGSLGTSPDWTATGSTVGGRFGWSVGSAGDVNRDGYSDVFIGEPYYSNGQTEEGRVVVYLGLGPGHTPSLPSSSSWSKEVDSASWHFGYCVSTAGDVNDDGYSDLIVGAPDYSNGETLEGTAYIYTGSSSGLSTSALSWSPEPDRASAQFGTFVGTAGDLNGDSVSDVIVGAPQDSTNSGALPAEGRAFAYLGSPSGLSASPFWSAAGGVANGNFGNWLVGIDDRSDFSQDLIVGVPGANKFSFFPSGIGCPSCTSYPSSGPIPNARQLGMNGTPVHVYSNNRPPTTPTKTFKLKVEARDGFITS